MGWVSRSKSITGPFTGDQVFYASSGNIHGPGHMGIYSSCGVERFTYHYYPNAVSVLGGNDLSWNSSDWPVAGAQSTKPLIPCGITGIKETRSTINEKSSALTMQNGVLMTVKDKVNFPAELAGTEKKITIFTYAGYLVARATVKNNCIDLKRDFGIRDGLYVVCVDKMEIVLMR